jgi:methylglyoxal reductase
MHHRPLGQSQINASVVALGTWAIGGWMWGGTDEQDAIRAIHSALDVGINFIDTAPVYGFGLSEEIVGKAIAGRRDQVVLATKCGLVWDDAKGAFHFASDDFGIKESGSRRVHRYLAPESIREEIERSLRRLKTDHIDLYQTHWQDPTTPIADTMGALLDLKREGKIRAIGVCNATAAQMVEYAKIGPLDTDQEKFSMLDRQIESDQLPYCREHNIAMLAYSPLALGLLTGKIGSDREFGEGDLRIGKPRFSVENRRRVAAMLADFQPVADRHGLTPGQLCIAWTLAQPGLTHALVGARNPQQALENARAGAVELSAEDVRAIDAALAKHAGYVQ